MREPIPFAVIFDMDGTLFKTEYVAIQALRRTFQQLQEEGSVKEKSPTDDEIKNVFGMTMDMIWERLLPTQPKAVRKKADQLMLDYELDELKKGSGELYPGVTQTLQQLKQEKIPLFVASNGLDEYIQAVSNHMNIDHFFTDLYSAGKFKTASKNDLVKKLLSDYDIKDGVMVGDRHSDVEAGKTNGLMTIACRFGFSSTNELLGADFLVSEFEQMLLPVLQYKERVKNSQLS